MREILFRAKRKNGTWIEGNLLFYPDVNQAYIHTGDYYHGGAVEVDRNTIGQYTGLLDKNGKRIFEGDVVVYDNSPYNAYCSPQKGVIVWRNGTLCFKVKPYKCVMYRALCTDDFFAAKCEIIGNNHDNPELMEGGEGDG